MGKYTKIIIPTIYIAVIGLMVAISSLVLTGINKYVNKTDYNYTLDDVFSSDIYPVMKTETDSIVRPYISSEVSVGKYFYDYESDETKQKESLIYYENTYLQNTGVDYISNESFEIVSILDGEVIGIEDSDIYGKILTIKHNDNLISVYSNIKDILVTVGYKVSQGEIIATSDTSKLDTEVNSLLHFEVKYKDSYIDPESLYTLKVSDLQ